MANYYYFVSSLSLLAYDQVPALTPAAFDAMCQEQLSREDYELVHHSHLAGFNNFDNVKTKNPVLNKWYYWEINLRNELVKLRAQKQNRDAAKYLHQAPYVFGADSIANEAFNQPQPLATEEVLDQARWSLLGDLENGHFFDIEKIIIYALKLQLLDKKRNRTANQGKEFFDHMIATKLTEMKAGEQK